MRGCTHGKITASSVHQDIQLEERRARRRLNLIDAKYWEMSLHPTPPDQTALVSRWGGYIYSSDWCRRQTGSRSSSRVLCVLIPASPMREELGLYALAFLQQQLC